MHFEVSDANHELGTIKLEEHERALINSALFNTLVTAATTGDQLTPGSPTEVLCSQLLQPKILNVLNISVRAGHLEALSTLVAEDNKNMAYNEAKVIGGFVTELAVAANVLRNSATVEAPLSQEEIDKIVDQFDIPESPEGLD